MPEAFENSQSCRNKGPAFNKSHLKTDPNVEQHSAAPVLRELSQMQFWTTLTWKRSQLGRLWSFPLRLQSFSTCSAQSDAKLAFTFALKATALSHVNNLSHYSFAHRQSVFDSLWMFPSFSHRLPLKWLNFYYRFDERLRQKEVFIKELPYFSLNFFSASKTTDEKLIRSLQKPFLQRNHRKAS